jgi:hypothetical protein
MRWPTPNWGPHVKFICLRGVTSAGGRHLRGGLSECTSLQSGHTENLVHATVLKINKFSQCQIEMPDVEQRAALYVRVMPIIAVGNC